MKRHTLTVLALTVSWGATLAALLVFPDRIPAHWNAAGEVDRWGSKFETLILPAVQLLLVAALAVWPRFDPSRRGPWRAWPLLVAASAWTLTLVQLGVLYLTWRTLQNAALGPEQGLRALLFVLGLVFVVVGNYLPKAPQNWLFGVRTPWTLSSPRVWQVANRAGGWIFIALALALALAAPAAAQSAAAARVEALFTQKIESRWFAPTFLKQVPAAQVAAIVRQLAGSLGAFEGVRPEGAGFAAVFEKGEVPVSLTLDAQGRIAGLFFGPPRPRLASLADAETKMAALPGKKGFLVQKGDAVLASLDPDARLAVGSAFKLSVLAALLDRIEAGELGWEATVPLKGAWKSLPSGALGDWPAGTPVSIASLVGRMMSESDNTATDHLIGLLGPERVEAYAYANRPLLTTRAAFTIKANPELARRWAAAGEAERRKIVAEAATRPLPTVQQLFAAPPAPEVEWFYSARELCELAARAADTPLSGINPGLARREAWKRVVYKGGSEPGVLNLTTWLEDDAGTRYCVVATWNAEDLDENALFGLYGAVLELLARERP